MEIPASIVREGVARAARQRQEWQRRSRRRREKRNDAADPSSLLVVGYTTMTCDIAHGGHVNFLQTASSMCDRLIVGLTVDELAIKQKRRPVVPYRHRKSVVQAFSFVHSVVEHRGHSKLEDWKRLRFHKLFIGDDYVDSKEYQDFANACPEVPVVFIPRTAGISTSKMLHKVQSDVLFKSFSVRCHTLSGPLLQFSLDRQTVLCKPIRLGERESDARNGMDVYGLASPEPPRNWKRLGDKKQRNKYPMIPGLNGHREIEILKELKGKPWCPFLFARVVHTEEEEQKRKDLPKERWKRIEHMMRERQEPAKTVWVYMRDAGATIADWLDKHKMALPVSIVMSRVRAQIDVLKSMRIVHGDLHPKNVCYNHATGEVSFIDYGWANSLKFVLSAEERARVTADIANDADWQHFVDSIKWFGYEERLLMHKE